jgi:hypothetical protein
MLHFTQDDLISELSPMSGIPKRTQCFENGAVCALRQSVRGPAIMIALPVRLRLGGALQSFT